MKQSKRLCTLVLTVLASVACGADRDVLINPPPGESPPSSPPQQQNEDPNDPGNDQDDLDDADQLTSGDEEETTGCGTCPTPVMGASCCTASEDIAAHRATEENLCGVDMSEFGFPGCAQLGQPGVLDSACPEVEFPPGPPMPGCCTAAGHCGAMETFVGFGCTSNPDSSTWVPCGG